MIPWHIHQKNVSKLDMCNIFTPFCPCYNITKADVCRSLTHSNIEQVMNQEPHENHIYSKRGFRFC